MPHWPLYTGTVKSISNSNVKKVLSLLGDPQLNLQNVIHVVGTNGKGSTTAYLKSILKEHGFSVNTYTSPHLVNCNERININGSDISDEDLFYYTEKTKNICQDNNIELTIFEATTITAMLRFDDKKADYNIIEAGMGGLHDATNIFNPSQVKCVIITPVSLDHVKFLGNTKMDIIDHKIQVSQGKIPIVASSQDADVNNYIANYVNHYNLPLGRYGINFEAIKIENEDGTIDKENFCLSVEGEEYILPLPPLLGEHQLVNLSTSVYTLIRFMDFELDYQKLINGIKNTKWRGRLEEIKYKKVLNHLPDDSKIYFDGAHNEGGAIALANFIKEQKQNMPEYKIFVIIGRSKDADTTIFAKHFVNLLDGIVAIRSNCEARPESEITIYNQILNANFTQSLAHKAKSLKQALEIIKEEFCNDKCLVFIAGSLYLAREIKLLANGQGTI